jgi:hypothetical protein
MKIRTYVCAAMLGLLAVSAQAQDYKAGPITVSAPWVRASAPGQTNGAGYLEIANSGAAPDRLVGVSSAAAELVEVHTVVMQNGMAQMRPADDGVAVPAGGRASLAPGGYHVMFTKLKAPFAQGAEIPAVLKFEKSGEVAVKFTVRPIGYQGGGMGGMGDMGGMGGMKH